MTYVSPATFIEKLKNLKSDYKKRTDIDLDTAKQPNRLFCKFGFKDVETRKPEMEFVAKWYQVLSADLAKEGTDQHHDHIIARRILTVVDLSLINEIGNECTIPSTARSTTRQLIQEAKDGETKEGEKITDNLMDDNTKAACFFSAQRFFMENKFDQVNAMLENKFTEKEWSKLYNYIHVHCVDFEKNKNVKKSYPITRLSMDLFGTAGKLAGTSFGWVAGDVCANTTKMMPVKGKIAVMIGCGMYMMMGASAGTGVMILTPAYAARLVEALSGFTLSWLCGVILGAVGNIVGWSIGRTLDLSWQLVIAGFHALLNLAYDSSKLPKISGYLLTDGTQVIDGVVVKPISNLSEIPEGSIYVPYKIDEEAQELTINYNNEEFKVPLKNIQSQPQPYIPELMQMIAAGSIKKAPELIPPENDTQDSLEALIQAEENKYLCELH